MTDLSQLTPEQLQALQTQLGNGSPAPAPSQNPYPATDGYQPNPAQNATAWSLYNAGHIGGGDPRQAGSQNFPTFAVPGRPATPGSYFIDQGGALRQAGQNDDGAPQDSGVQHLSTSDLHAVAAELANSNPAMSTAEDWARSGVTGLERGLTSMAATPGSIRDLALGLANKGGNALANFAGAPDKNNTIGQVMDIVRNSPVGREFGATPQQFDAGVQQVAGPYHIPQSVGGQYAQTIGEFAPAAATGGEGLLARGASVLVPAVASESAGQLTKGMDPRIQAAARIAGGLAGGLSVGVAQGMTQAAPAAMGGFIPGLADEHIAAAQALRQSAAARGLNLTIPEAVQQVTNNGTGLGRLQRIVESSRHGGELTAPYFAARPGQVQNAVADYLDTIAPASNQPSMIGAQAQGAATTALNRARQVVNSVANPDYAALPSQTMDPAQYAEIADNPSYQVALRALRNHAELGPPVAGLPDNNLSVINEVNKRLGTMADEAAGTPMTTSDNQLAGLRTGAKGLADAIARDASPQYANARDTVANLSQQFVDPLKAGPVGAISQSADTLGNANALYPAQPLEGASNETAQAVRVLNNTSPGVADALTRQRLAGALDSSMRDLQGGPNQYGGANFAVNVAGRPEQQAALQAGISELPGGTAKWDDLSNLLEGLRATGRRLPVGSNTAEKTIDLAKVGSNPVINFFKNLDIAKPTDFIGEAMGKASARHNAQKLADLIMAHPDQTSAILNAARNATPTNQILPPAVLNALSGSANAGGQQ